MLSRGSIQLQWSKYIHVKNFLRTWKDLKLWSKLQFMYIRICTIKVSYLSQHTHIQMSWKSKSLFLKVFYSWYSNKIHYYINAICNIQSLLNFLRYEYLHSLTKYFTAKSLGIRCLIPEIILKLLKLKCITFCFLF